MSVFSIPYSGHYLIYAPLADYTALVNTVAFEQLRKAATAGTSHLSSALFQVHQALYDTLHLCPGPKSGSFAPEFVGFITTRGCNMSCVYCDFHAASTNMDSVSLRAAEILLEWTAENLKKREKKLLDVQFFGGEPFLPIKQVRVIIDNARRIAKAHDLEVHFGACTNAAFGVETARWIAAEFDSIIVSLDGASEIQDSVRPMRSGGGSFATIDRNVQILTEGSLEIAIRICVTQQNVEKLSQIVEWMCRRYRPGIIIAEPLKQSRQTTDSVAQRAEPEIFIRQFCAGHEIAQRYGIELGHATSQIDKIQASFCPTGRDGLIIDPDGTLNSCYLLPQDWRNEGLELEFGRVSPLDGIQIDMQNLSLIRQMVVGNKPRCTDCFCKWHCAGGCHVAHTPPDSSADYSDVCIETRAITLWKLLKGLGREEMADAFLKHPIVEDDSVLTSAS